MHDLPERDWKTLRQLKDAALERFCRRVLEKLVKTASDESRSYHERYLAIYKLVQEQDEELALVFDGLSRSTAALKLAAMHHRGLLTDAEMQRFSPDAHAFLNRMKAISEKWHAG